MWTVAVDTETALTSPGAMVPPVTCVSVAVDPSRGEVLDHVAGCALLRDLLLDVDARIVGHHIAYDVAVTSAEDPSLLSLWLDAYAQERIYDTGIRQKLADISAGCYRGFERADGKSIKIGYSLADLATRALGVTLDKTSHRLSYGPLRGVPLDAWPAGAVDYAAVDAASTLAIYEVQERELPAAWLVDQHRQTRASLWIHIMGCVGLDVDAQALARFRSLVEAERSDIERTLVREGLVAPEARLRTGRVVPASRQLGAVKTRLASAYQALGKEPPTTDSGAVSTDRTACEDSGDPVLVAYADYSRLGSYLSKDIAALEAAGGKTIHSRFESLLESGRTGSSGPNVQNFPRRQGARECIIPPRGRVFATADYAGAELCTLAQSCIDLLGRSRLADALNQGVDPHLLVASRILGKPYDLCLAVKKTDTAIEGITPDMVSDARQTGKVANFGLPGGLGAKTLVFYAWQSYRVRLTEEDARRLKSTWLEEYPEMQDYFSMVSNMVESAGYVTQLRSGRVRGGLSFTNACNTFFQGLASDMAKEAGWSIFLAQAGRFGVSHPLARSMTHNFIHDEFVLSVPDDDGAHDAAIALADTMLDAAKKWIPDVRIKVEPMLVRRMSKHAKALYDARGRLTPWEESWRS